MSFTSAQKRHYRRSKVRNIRRSELDEFTGLENLYLALNQDDVNQVASMLHKHPQFKTQTLICSVQSIRMAQMLVDMGVPCNYWTLEGAETKACIDFIRNHTSIRG